LLKQVQVYAGRIVTIVTQNHRNKQDRNSSIVTGKYTLVPDQTVYGRPAVSYEGDKFRTRPMPYKPDDVPIRTTAVYIKEDRISILLTALVRPIRNSRTGKELQLMLKPISSTRGVGAGTRPGGVKRNDSPLILSPFTNTGQSKSSFKNRLCQGLNLNGTGRRLHFAGYGDGSFCFALFCLTGPRT